MIFGSLGCGWDAACAFCKNTFRCFSKKQNVCSVECRFALYTGSVDPESGCQNWTGPINNEGYGVLFLKSVKANGGRQVKSAHRFSYEKYVGPIPDSMCLMHSCDNRRCVNPAHLSVGTWSENNKDRSIKGRSGSKTYSAEDKEKYSKMFRGSGNANAKLTEEQAREIKYCTTMGCAQLAKKFGVSRITVQTIRSGRAWKHV